MSKIVLSMTIKLPPHNENPPDKTLLRGSDEKYFWPWLCKHHPEKTDAGSHGVEVDEADCRKERAARYANVRSRKRSGLKQAVRM